MQQARFISDEVLMRSTPWQVPIEIISSADPSMPVSKLLLTKNEDVLTVDGVKPTDWIKLNAATSGFYRVRYSDEMLSALLRPLSPNNFVPEPVAKTSRWEPQKEEDSQVGLLRALVLEIDDGTDLLPDLRGVVFGCAGRSNVKERSAKLQYICETCNFSEVEKTCIIAMAQTSDKELLETVFSGALIEERSAAGYRFAFLWILVRRLSFARRVLIAMRLKCWIVDKTDCGVYSLNVKLLKANAVA
uniref:Uncharacterized protein n=1 Tax=Ditylenchus dipsaci TaxID=166011 RepID=A0A915DG94_9BILA